MVALQKLSHNLEKQSIAQHSSMERNPTILSSLNKPVVFFDTDNVEMNIDKALWDRNIHPTEFDEDYSFSNLKFVSTTEGGGTATNSTCTSEEFSGKSVSADSSALSIDNSDDISEHDKDDDKNFQDDILHAIRTITNIQSATDEELRNAFNHIVESGMLDKSLMQAIQTISGKQIASDIELGEVLVDLMKPYQRKLGSDKPLSIQIETPFEPPIERPTLTKETVHTLSNYKVASFEQLREASMEMFEKNMLDQSLLDALHLIVGNNRSHDFMADVFAHLALGDDVEGYEYKDDEDHQQQNELHGSALEDNRFENHLPHSHYPQDDRDQYHYFPHEESFNKYCDDNHHRTDSLQRYNENKVIDESGHKDPTIRAGERLYRQAKERSERLLIKKFGSLFEKQIKSPSRNPGGRRRPTDCTNKSFQHTKYYKFHQTLCNGYRVPCREERRRGHHDDMDRNNLSLDMASSSHSDIAILQSKSDEEIYYSSILHAMDCDRQFDKKGSFESCDVGTNHIFNEIQDAMYLPTILE